MRDVRQIVEGREQQTVIDTHQLYFVPSAESGDFITQIDIGCTNYHSINAGRTQFMKGEKALNPIWNPALYQFNPTLLSRLIGVFPFVLKPGLMGVFNKESYSCFLLLTRAACEKKYTDELY